MFSIIAVPQPPRLDSKLFLAVAVAAIVAATAIPARASSAVAAAALPARAGSIPAMATDLTIGTSWLGGSPRETMLLDAEGTLHLDGLDVSGAVGADSVMARHLLGSEFTAGKVDAREVAVDRLTLRNSNQLIIGFDGAPRFVVDRGGAHDGLGHTFATKNDLAEAVLAGVLGGVTFSVFMTVLGLTLFARAFALRRWIARAHRSLAERMPPYR